MTVTASQISKAKAEGLQNVDAIAAASNKTGCPFYLALAMVQRESNGRNVYGGDSGGVLSGFKEPVDRSNYLAFRHEVIVKGRTSNGVGPAQITSRGLLKEMEAAGLDPSNPKDNIYFGVKLIYGYYKDARETLGVRDSIKKAGTEYNGAESYGEGLLKMALEWKDRVGGADYA